MKSLIINEDCLTGIYKLPPRSVNCVVTSPPYFGLRDYGVDGQIGLEQTPHEYVDKLVAVFREAWRVLRDDGTLWLNLGDSYVCSSTGSVGNKCHIGGGNKCATQIEASKRPDKTGFGLASKQLIGIPWRVAFALQADGWYLRQDIIWHKPNPMPESVKDRCTNAHEYIFMLSKSPRYYFDAESIQEDAVGGIKGAAASFKREDSKRGQIMCPNSPIPTHRKDRKDVRYDGPKRNRRDVWTVATRPCKEAHFATFPPDLIRPCILAGAPKHGIVLDPFMGAGTTALVCKQEHRQYVGFELNPDYIQIANRRIANIGKEAKDAGK